MQFSRPLFEGRLINRYKRFLADIQLLQDEETITAHCPNPGSMMGLAAPGNTVFVSPAENAKRKLRFTWELVNVEGSLVGINTSRTNSLVEEALLEGEIEELQGYAQIRREARYGERSRFDFFLENDAHGCFVEVKSVTLVRGREASFPDSVTKRGARHLHELCAAKAEGYRAVVCFVIQRCDASHFVPAADIDPEFAAALKQAHDQGVEIIAYQSEVSVRGIRLHKKLPLSIQA